MTVLSTPNNSAIAFWVAQIVSSSYNTCMPFSFPSAIKVRNSAVLFRISKFFATIPLVINYHMYKGMENTQKSITRLYSGCMVCNGIVYGFVALVRLDRLRPSVNGGGCLCCGVLRNARGPMNGSFLPHWWSSLSAPTSPGVAEVALRFILLPLTK